MIRRGMGRGRREEDRWEEEEIRWGKGRKEDRR